jgi:hypothetical protein
MSERQRILDMLGEGKINVEEAERLLLLVEQAPPLGPADSGQVATRRQAKYLHVIVGPTPDSASDNGGERVNVRVPMALIRAGMKLAALIPQHAAVGLNDAMREKGIELDVRNLKGDELEQLVDALEGLEVDIQDGNESVRVFIE